MEMVLLLLAAVFLNPIGLFVLIFIAGKDSIEEKVKLLVKYLAGVVVVAVLVAIINPKPNSESSACIDLRGYYEC